MLRFHREGEVVLRFQPAVCFSSSSVSSSSFRSRSAFSLQQQRSSFSLQQRSLRQQQPAAAFRTAQQRFSNLQQQ